MTEESIVKELINSLSVSTVDERLLEKIFWTLLRQEKMELIEELLKLDSLKISADDWSYLYICCEVDNNESLKALIDEKLESDKNEEDFCIPYQSYDAEIDYSLWQDYIHEHDTEIDRYLGNSNDSSEIGRALDSPYRYLKALKQACVHENYDVVKYLIEKKGVKLSSEDKNDCLNVCDKNKVFRLKHYIEKNI